MIQVEPRRGWWRTIVGWVRAPLRLGRYVPPAVGPFELHLFGKTLGSAALVGLFAGLVGAAFVRAVEAAQDLLLGRLAGATLLRALGMSRPSWRPRSPRSGRVAPAGARAQSCSSAARWGP